MPSAADMELLDLLTAMPSAFPHSGNGLSSPSSASYPTGPVIAGKRRPLATLAALRRPPIDPIILAASLSSGPHVTRHHFHHSYGDKAGGGCHGCSHQMPASQRRAIEAEERSAARNNKSRSATTGQIATASRRSINKSREHHKASRKQRSHSITGSYANCDGDDETDDGASGPGSPAAVNDMDDVPEVSTSEAALYASKQAPRSVRLRLEEEQRKAREAAAEKRQLELADQRKKHEDRAKAAHAEEIAKESAIRASEEEPASNGKQSNAPSQTSGTQALLKQALSERQAIASAPVTPSLPPTPGAQNKNPWGDDLQAAPQLARLSSIVRPPPLQVRCYARTRIPTPHGEIFCHLYRNNHDNKEHLALVVDPAQNEPDVNIENLLKPAGPKGLRSKTLDEKWSPEETEMERIVRGAYVGRLGPSCQVASQAPPKGGRGARHPADVDDADEWEAPLVRIHSECYTGETIGSQRCDCGEQLDEALRLILHSGSGTEPDSLNSQTPKRPRLPRGVVVYLRQEGRGIGLLDKLMAYNLQDMGHDTVSANVLLGHLPDARRYAAAAAILEDLGVSSCRLLTNNPEKMEALEGEGIGVTERVGMVPRAWLADMRRSKKKAKKRQGVSRRHKEGKPAKGRVSKLSSSLSEHGGDLASSILSQDGNPLDLDEHELGARHQGSDVDRSQVEDDEEEEEDDSDTDSEDYQQHMLRSSGATLIGGAATRGPELEKYLRTKVERMGHLLDLPPEEKRKHQTQQSQAGQRRQDDEEEEEEEGDAIVVKQPTQ